MKIITDLNIKDKIILTIGSFDGIHLGHKDIFYTMKKYAKILNAKTFVFSFSSHPRKIINPNFYLPILTSMEEKIDILDSLKLDYLFLQKFDINFMNKSAVEFLHYITDKLDIHYIILGKNHGFGKDRVSAKIILEKYQKKFDYQYQIIDFHKYKDQAISSTRIRKTIAAGNLEDANFMLGHAYTLMGKVSHGKKIGRTIGFPTINIYPESRDKIIPPNGVYLTCVTIEDTNFYGMTNVGCNPTISTSYKLKVESHLFNFNRDLYDKHVKISFIKKIRPEIKFSTIDQLVEQLVSDRQKCLEFLKL